MTAIASRKTGESIFCGRQGFLSGLLELGLRVEPMKTQAEFIVIDHAEKPDAYFIHGT
jgi:uncharacterized protein (TIGR03435 family)